MMWRLNYDGAVSDCNYGIQRNLVRTWGRERVYYVANLYIALDISNLLLNYRLTVCKNIHPVSIPTIERTTAQYIPLAANFILYYVYIYLWSIRQLVQAKQLV